MLHIALWLFISGVIITHPFPRAVRGAKRRTTDPGAALDRAHAGGRKTQESGSPAGLLQIQFHAQGDHTSGVSWAWDEANGCRIAQQAGANARISITTNLSSDIKCGRSESLAGGSVVFGNDNLYIGASISKARKMCNASAAPANGAHAVGDIVWSRKPIPGGYAGWICVVRGTPGTWKTSGTIER